jgi:hypothetical protein
MSKMSRHFFMVAPGSSESAISPAISIFIFSIQVSPEAALRKMESFGRPTNRRPIFAEQKWAPFSFLEKVGTDLWSTERILRSVGATRDQTNLHLDLFQIRHSSYFYPSNQLNAFRS